MLGHRFGWNLWGMTHLRPDQLWHWRWALWETETNSVIFSKAHLFHSHPCQLPFTLQPTSAVSSAPWLPTASPGHNVIPTQNHSCQFGSHNKSEKSMPTHTHTSTETLKTSGEDAHSSKALGRYNMPALGMVSGTFSWGEIHHETSTGGLMEKDIIHLGMWNVALEAKSLDNW